MNKVKKITEFEFWESLDINIEHFKENWQHYHNQLKKFFKEFDEQLLWDLHALLKLAVPVKNNKLKLIDTIINSDLALSLFCLREFMKYKVDPIEEHYAKLIKEEKIKKVFVRGIFLKLVQIYLINENELINILIRQYWNRNAAYESQYIPASPLKEELVKEFELGIDRFIKSLRGTTWNKTTSTLFGKIAENENFTYCITHQTGDKLIKNVDSNKRNKVAVDLLISFNLQQNLIRIRCKNKRTLPSIQKSFEKNIRLFISEKKTTINDFDPRRIVLSLEENPSQKLNVSGISFQESKLQGGAPLQIPALLSRPSILPAIEDLKTRNLIELKIQNINFLTVRYNDHLYEIHLSKNEGAYKYALKEKTKLTDSELIDISAELKLLIGAGLNEYFKLDFETVDNFEILNRILSQDTLESLDTATNTWISTLSNEGIIKSQVIRDYQCWNCRRINHVGTPCPHCREINNTQLHERTIIETSRDGVAEYISRKLNSDETLEIVDKRATRTWIKRHQFIRIKYQETNAYIYILLGTMSPKIISAFRRSGLPILIINVKRKINEELIGLTGIEQVDFCKILLGEISTSSLSAMIRESIIQTNTQVVTAARDSYNKLQSSEMEHTSFEDDTFNIIRYIFGSVEKWGKEKIGVELPEAFGEHDFMTGRGLARRTFSWDCKFTYQNQRSLSMNDKRQIESYLRLLNKSKVVKSASKRLNAFFIISNSLTEEEFGTLTAHIREKMYWRGNLVLIELSELLYLYKQYDTKYHTIITNINQFKNRLSILLFEKKKNNYFKLTMGQIDALFE